MTTYHITGNTYEHRDDIRRAGARWNKAENRWELEVIDRGMKRNDGLVYQLRKLSGLRVQAA